jgi:hypothetical protein
MDEPAYLRNLRELGNSDPKEEHLAALERELYASGSDRATAVMFGAFVEVHLERLIRKQLREDLNTDARRLLFGTGGALSTFALKTVMAFALKLIGPDTYFDLRLIRFLRNQFAHARVPLNFKTPEVRAVCEQFRLVDLKNTHIPFGYLNRVSNGELEAATDKNDSKTRYISTCHTISYRMIVSRDGPKAGDMVFVEGQILP